MKLKFPTELEAAHAGAQKSVSELTHVRGLIATAQSRIQAIDTQLEQAFQQLSVEEADAALQTGETPSTTTSSALATLETLRNERQRLIARVAGLESRTASMEDAILSTRQAFNRARSSYTNERFIAFEQEFRKKAEEFVRFARRGAILAESLGSALPGLSELAIPFPRDMTKTLASVQQTRFENGNHILFIPRDTESEALASELAPLMATAQAINRESEAILTARETAKRAQEAAEHEKEPAIRHSPLPISAYAAQKYDEAEAERERARQARTEIMNATEFPNDPARRSNFQVAHQYPYGGSGKPQVPSGGGKPQ